MVTNVQLTQKLTQKPIPIQNQYNWFLKNNQPTKLNDQLNKLQTQETTPMQRTQQHKPTQQKRNELKERDTTQHNTTSDMEVVNAVVSCVLIRRHPIWERNGLRDVPQSVFEANQRLAYRFLSRRWSDGILDKYCMCILKPPTPLQKIKLDYRIK